MRLFLFYCNLRCKSKEAKDYFAAFGAVRGTAATVGLATFLPVSLRVAVALTGDLPFTRRARTRRK
jgi:hypothetical protein